jgi:hypothetical protein
MSQPSIVLTLISAYLSNTADRTISINDNNTSPATSYSFIVSNSGTVLTSVSTTITAVPWLGSYSSVGTNISSKLISVVLSESITSIGNYAFQQSTLLTSCNIPSLVTSIGIHAFNECTSLSTPLVIPNTVTQIGRLAFFKNFHRTGTLTIPASVTSIGVQAFAQCNFSTVSMLANIIPSWTLKYKQEIATVGDYVKNNDGNAANLAKDTTTLVSIGDGETLLPDFGVLSGSNISTLYLTDVYLSDSITSIGTSFGFSNCSSLVNVYTTSNKLSDIKNNCFLNCSSLTYIILPGSVQQIRDSVFRGSGVKQLVIPASTTTIYNDAFYLSSLTDIIFEKPSNVTSFGTCSTGSSLSARIHCFNSAGQSDASVVYNRLMTSNASGGYGCTTIYYYNEKLKLTGLQGGVVVDGNISILYNIPSSLNLNTGELGSNLYTLKPYSISKGNITFSSSNTSVASFANNSVGNIYMHSSGTTTITVSQAESTTSIATSKSFTLTAVVPTPTITLTIPNKVYNETFTVNATSNSTGNLTYTSENTSIATVSGNTVTTVGVGNAIIRVDQAAGSGFATGNLNVNFTVSKANQVISNFPSTVSGFYGNNYQYSPTFNGNGIISYQSGNSSIATVDSSGVVTPVAIGNTTIRVIHESNAFYNDISASSTFTVNKGNTVISLSNISKTFGNPSFQINATSTPNSDGAYTYISENLFVANITSGNTVNIIGAGSTTISVSQAETTFYNSATGNATITVDKAVPTITFSNISKTNEDPIFRIDPSSNPVSNSDGAFTFSSSNTDVVQITDFSANIVGLGTSIITASQAESNNYLARDISATLTVTNALPLPNITFTNISKTYGDPIFRIDPSLNPVSDSDGAFTFSSSNTDVVQITDFSANIVGAGNAIITASQAATSDYLARDISAILIVAKALPTITGFTVPDKVFRDVSFALIPPSSTPSTGAFTYSSGNTAIASITDGNYIVINGAGNTTITATQEATSNYGSGSITANITVAKAEPAITFNNMSKTFVDQAFTLNASSDSTGTFNYVSGNTSVATISGNTVTIVGAGSVDITTTQDSDENYNQGSAIATLTIAKATPSITFSDMSKTYGDYFTISRPQTSSTGSVVYESLDTNIATINNNVVSVVGVGSTTIRATLSSDNNYNSRIVTATLTSVKATPTITFSAINKSYGSSAFTAPISTNSSGSIQYTSSNTGVATVGLTTGLITVLTIGNTTITAVQSADSNYNARTVTSVLTVSKANPSMGNFPNISKKVGNVPFELTAPSTNSTGAISYESSNPRVATILNNIVTIIGPGTAIITAVQNATTNYNQGVITAFLIVDDVDRIVPNSPTPPNVAGPLIRTQNRRPGVRMSRKLAMRSKRLPGSVQYYH